MQWQYEIINGALVHRFVDHNEPMPGEVQIGVEAAALNYRDVGIVAGHYPCISPLVPASLGLCRNINCVLESLFLPNRYR